MIKNPGIIWWFRDFCLVLQPVDVKSNYQRQLYENF